MNLLTPLFLLGALAIAIPVYLHLRRQRTRRDVPFSSLMFLNETPIRLESRRTPEHLALLVLRVLAVALLALAFARPYLSETPPLLAANPGERVVILLDRSASMRREGLWAQALAHVDKTVGRLKAGDKLSVLSFDATAAELMSFEDWGKTPPGERTGALSTRLATVRPGWGATDLGRALVRGADLLSDDHARTGGTTVSGRIVLVSDLQTGASLAAVEGSVWPAGIKVDLLPVTTRDGSNAGLAVHGHLAIEEDNTKPAAVTRVRVNRTEGGTASALTLRWEAPGLDGTPKAIDLPPGNQRVVEMPGVPSSLTGAALRLSGDADDFDNVLFLAPPLPSQAQVVYIGSDDGTNAQAPLFFISRAFPPTNTRTTTVHGDKATAAGFLTSAHLAIVTQEPNETTMVALEALCARGGVVLLTADSPRITSKWGVATNPRAVAPSAIVAAIDQAHPLMSPFAETRFADFTRVNFWRRTIVTPGPAARTLWRFDDGSPALLVAPRGLGQVLVLASGLGPKDSQLPLSSKFVPFLHALLDAGAGPSAGRTQFFIGDPVPMPARNNAARIVRPDGTITDLPPDAAVFADTTAPGLYRFESDGQPARVFAINLAPTESLTTPLPLERLERLSLGSVPPPLPSTAKAGAAASAWATEVESRQKSWRWVLLALLALFVIEIAWAASVSSKNTKVPS